jgi:hypothetical protein
MKDIIKEIWMGDRRQLFLVLAFIVCFFIIVGAISNQEAVYGQERDSSYDTPRTDSQITEFQMTACQAAHGAGTCQTRLPELGIITPQQCCEYLEMCC